LTGELIFTFLDFHVSE